MRPFGRSDEIPARTDERPVFYPWSFLGRGYVLASHAECQRLQRRRWWSAAVAAAVVFGAGSVFGLRGAQVAAGCLLVLELSWLAWIGRGVPRTERRPTLREELERRARTEGSAGLWLQLLLASLFTLGCVVWAVLSHLSLMAVVGVVFFGLASLQAAAVLGIQRRAGSSRPSGGEGSEA